MLLTGWCLLSVWMVEPLEVRVGESAEGRPIVAFALGEGPVAVLLIGGIHGGAELNSAAVVWELLGHFQSTPALVPHGLSLVFVPEANPDGLAHGTRALASGVDANRNWPTPDWSPDTFGPGGREIAGGGGDTPFSEPETRALANLIELTRPLAIVSFHSAAGLAMGGSVARASGLLDAYAAGSRYPVGDFLAYPVSGDLAQWCDEQHLPTIEIELSDHAEPETDRNLAGVAGILRLIAADDQSY